nr:hypothetical protein [Tanacetum cinerariifolium]
MFKLGRKDIRPIVMEMTIKDSKEPEEHHVDEHGNRNKDEKLAHDHESEEHEEIGDNKHRDGREDKEVENESGKDDTSSRNIPSVDDESQLGSSQSRQINTTPVSYSMPSVDHETATSADGNLTDSNNSNRNEKNDEGDIDSGAQDMEQVPNENKDDASVLEDEKDAFTDLGTLSDNETGGHITNEDSDTE